MLEVLFCRLGPQMEERGERELNTSIAYSLLTSFEVLFIYYICVYVHTCMHMLEGACLSQVMHGGQRTTLLSLFPPFIFLGITE